MRRVLAAVAAAALVLAAVAAAAPGDPAARWAGPAPVRILTIGDSRTSTGEWQAELDRLLTAAGVAHEVTNVAVAGTDCHYWADRIGGLLDQYIPDVVVSACGTNDSPSQMIWGEPVTGWSVRTIVETVHARRPRARIVVGLVQYSDPILAPDWLLTNEPQVNDLIYRNMQYYTGPSWNASFADFQPIPATASYLAADPYPYPPYWIGIHPTPRGYKYMGRIVYQAAATSMGWPPVEEPPLCDLYGHRKGYARPAYAPCN